MSALILGGAPFSPRTILCTNCSGMGTSFRSPSAEAVEADVHLAALGAGELCADARRRGKRSRHSLSVLSILTTGAVSRICTCIRLQLTSSTAEMDVSSSTLHFSLLSMVTPLHLPLMSMVASQQP